jgi:type II secretory pathway pseudopilin PulG
VIPPRLPSRHHRLTQAQAAFTLIEVILAIGLATALLLVALTFYQQAANLRTQILRASQDLSAIRLTLDQIAFDLRAATPVPSVSFIGGPNSVEFARMAPPSNKPHSTNGIFAAPSLQRLTINALVSQNGTNLSVRGLARTESPLFRPPSPDSLQSTNSLPAPPSNPASTATNSPPEPQNRPFTEAIHFLNFRYWNGSSWQDSWFASAPPPGIEITLGADPIPDDATPENYPYERFRRVVLIPSGRAADTTLSDTNAEPFDVPPPSLNP